MLTSDADLARIEPQVFIEAQHAGQRLTRGTASITGTTLTAVGVEVAFDAAMLAPGHVCVVDGQTYEIVERTGATTLTISRVRAPGQPDVQPPSPATNRPMHVVTFAPQGSIAHAQVMRSIGIEPDAQIPGEPTVDSIMNPGALVRLEALAALQLIWMSAALNAGADAAVAARADRWRSEYARERERVGAFVDLDGDGFPDAVRRPSIVQLTRA